MTSDYIDALMAAYTILFLKHLIVYYCITASHTRPPDKIANGKLILLFLNKNVYWG